MINYRSAAAEDAPALADLGHASFVDAFGHLYSSENLNRFLEQTYSLSNIESELANPDRLFRIAERAGRMVGYCKLGFDATLDHDSKGRRVMELKQLYMLGDETGSGIGAELMTWALGEAHAREFDDIILSVWSENHAAQRFYARYGFEKIGDTIFMVGDHRDEEYLMGLRLR
ncbi:MAG: GNAT family N-acetyltransferase [Sphingomonadaceae bacterium]